MSQKKTPPKIDHKEFELPETVFVRDIENRVFQSIILQCLAKIDGIGLVSGNFLDNLLGRGTGEGTKGIFAEQDSHNHSVSIRVEVNIRYGVSIPEKAEEIQSRVADTITNLTGLHVAEVHVVFKNILHSDSTKQLMSEKDASLPTVNSPTQQQGAIEENSSEYADDF